jgi:acyl-CoA thioesterase-1
MASMVRTLWLALAMLLPCVATAAPAILVYGDSLSAGYGIAQERGWVALLGKRLESEGLHYSVVNASISGEISRGGLERLPEVLARTHPAVMILELGANDGLRGLPIAQMKANLGAMIRLAKKAHARVVLVGMKLPPNYGPDYTRAFESAFVEVAREDRVALVPFLLQGIARDEALFQSDGLHPTAAVQPVLLDNVWTVLRPLLR